MTAASNGVSVVGRCGRAEVYRKPEGAPYAGDPVALRAVTRVTNRVDQDPAGGVTQVGAPLWSTT